MKTITENEIADETIEGNVVEHPTLSGVYFFATNEFDLSSRTVTDRIYQYSEGDDDLKRLWNEAYQPGDFTFDAFGDYEAPRFRVLGVRSNDDETELVGLAQWYSDSPSPCANALNLAPSDGRKYFSLDINDPSELKPNPTIPADAIAAAEKNIREAIDGCDIVQE